MKEVITGANAGSDGSSNMTPTSKSNAFNKPPRATLEQRIKILDYYHKHKTSQAQIVNTFKDQVSISGSSLSEWVKKEQEFRSRYKELQTKNRAKSKVEKRRSQYKYQEMNDMMDEFVRKLRAENRQITEPILREHWSRCAPKIGMKDPKRLKSFSNGWLTLFKKRHGLSKQAQQKGNESESTNSSSITTPKNDVSLRKENSSAINEIFNYLAPVDDSGYLLPNYDHTGATSNDSKQLNFRKTQQLPQPIIPQLKQPSLHLQNRHATYGNNLSNPEMFVSLQKPQHSTSSQHSQQSTDSTNSSSSSSNMMMAPGLPNVAQSVNPGLIHSNKNGDSNDHNGTHSTIACNDNINDNNKKTGTSINTHSNTKVANGTNTNTNKNPGSNTVDPASNSTINTNGTENSNNNISDNSNSNISNNASNVSGISGISGISGMSGISGISGISGSSGIINNNNGSAVRSGTSTANHGENVNKEPITMSRPKPTVLQPMHEPSSHSSTKFPQQQSYLPQQQSKVINELEFERFLFKYAFEFLANNRDKYPGTLRMFESLKQTFQRERDLNADERLRNLFMQR